MSTKSGYVSVLGLPNAGKSTLINRVLGTKVMAVSRKPQTTRNNILGIFTIPDMQIIFTDTPGYHSSEKEMNRFFVKEAISASKAADIIVYIFDGKELSTHSKASAWTQNSDFLKIIRSEKPESVILPVISKMDLVRRKDIKNLIDNIKKEYKISLEPLELSAPLNFGVLKLIEEIKKLLPAGPFYYPEDDITDRNMRFLSAEIIREKVFRFTHEELPYSCAVLVTKYQESDKIHKIYADIYLEKESQKSIILGKNGAMIKRIGTEARKEIEELTGVKVYLELFVKIRKNWTKDPKMMEELGYK